MEIVQLKANDFEDAMDFMDLVFSKAHGPMDFASFLPRIYQPTDEDMGHNFAVRENGKIRAVVGLFPDEIQVGEETLRLGGIGGVSAHPRDRGKGWMKLLMNHCTGLMKADQTDLSFLTGRRQRYQYFGYEKAGIVFRYSVDQDNIRHTQKKQPDMPQLHFVPLKDTDRSYLEAMKKLHDSQPLHCVRPLDQFYLFLVSAHAKPWAALDENGQIVGYLVTNKEETQIVEIFAENDVYFTSMIYCWFAEQKIEETDILLTPWQDSYAHILSQMAEEYQIIDSGNWRVYNWEKVIGALLKLKQSRTYLLNGTALIGIDGYGTLQICVSDGKCTCCRTDQQADWELDQLRAMRTLLGHLPAELHGEIPAAVQEQVKSWFPLPLSWLTPNHV